MLRRALPLSVLTALGLLSASASVAPASLGAGGAAPLVALERAYSDRPDDVAGPQVHVVYAIPADGADLGLDVNGAITSSAASFGKWLIGQTGGRWLRVDSYRGYPDVTFVRLSATAAEVARPDRVGTAFATALVAAGLSRSANKVYAVYYGGTSNFTCGGSFFSPSVDFGVVFLERTGACGYERLLPGWPSVPDAKVPDLSRVSLAALHETLHVLRFVPSCAPHHDAGHVNDDPHDIMSGKGFERPYVLDAGRDDYYTAPIAGCLDLADSPYLVDAPRYALTLSAPKGGTIVAASGATTATCPPTCSAAFPAFADVTVTARAKRGHTFARWSGSCSGPSPCFLQMTEPQTVGARFTPLRHLLRVAVGGKGRVVARGARIACPKRCSARLAHGSRVTLRARPLKGWRFSGWAPARACRGTRPCTLRLTRTIRVHATFRRRGA